MTIGTEIVTTPAENPIAYALDWRGRLARAAVEAGVTKKKLRAVFKDDDAYAYAQHLLRGDGKPEALCRVTAWRASPAAGLIEAFLIAGPTVEDAARELALPAAEIRLYASLFCDLQDGDGQRRPAVLMKLRADLAALDEADPAVWLRKLALTGGVCALRRVLNTGTSSVEPALDQLVEAELTRRLHAGELRTGDLVRLHANGVARARLALEQKVAGNQNLPEGLELVRHMLGLVAPQMIRCEKTPDQEEANTQAIQSRLAAQRNIVATPLIDEPERGTEALERMMNAQFRGAASDA